MKNLTIKLSACYLLALFMIFSGSCKKEVVTPPTPSGLKNLTESNNTGNPVNRVSLTASDIIDLSIQNWNANYGTTVQGISYTYFGTIDDAAERLEVIRDITKSTSFAPYGNIYNPSTVGAKQLKDFSYNASRYRSLVSSLVSVGNEVYLIRWQIGNRTFSTKAVFDGDVLAYGNMLSNSMLLGNSSSLLDGGSTPDPIECFDPKETSEAKFYYIFGRLRGETSITVEVDCECEDEECEYFDKDYDAVAWMELGNAKAELNWIDSPDKEKCAKYAAYMSFETPVADVKASFNVQQGSFEVEVKGIGSHFFRQWTSTLCCQGYCDLTGSSQ